MCRVLLIQFQQEVSSFNPALTSYDDFEMVQGAAMLDAYADTNTFLAGALETLDAAADVAVVPHNLVFALPDALSYEQGAYAMLLATALQAVRRGDVELGSHVVVAGLGLVGQLTARLHTAYVNG